MENLSQSTTVRMSDIATLVKRPKDLTSEISVRSIGVKWYGKGAYVAEEKPVSELNAARFEVRANDLIYNDMWARNGSVAIVPPELDKLSASAHFPTWELDLTRVFPPFLTWYFKTPKFWAACEEKSQGSTGRNAITKSLFRELILPLPSLESQRRIVAQIDALATQIEEARGFRRSALEESENVLDQETKAIFENLDAESIPLKLLATKIGSGSTPLGGRASYPETGIPFIRSQNVRMRYFQWEGLAFIDEATHSAMNGTQFKSNDVLLNITGASIGRVACVPQDMPDGNLNQHVAIIRPIETLTPRYLMYWLSQPAIQQLINNEQKGATRQGFTKAQIERFLVPVPDLPTQRQIAARLDVLQAHLDALRNLQRQSAAELDALMPSILDRAFRGEL